MGLLLRTFVFLLACSPAVAEVVTYICQFEYRIDEEGRNEELFSLVFKIDTISHHAIMEGNVGLVDVDIYVGEDALSFVERIGSGAVQTTTITRDSAAVHSRNTLIFGKFVAAQHFGRCGAE